MNYLYAISSNKIIINIVAKGDFCGADGTYPVNSLKRAKSALKLAHNAENPEKIKECVYAKFPELKEGSKISRRRKK